MAIKRALIAAVVFTSQVWAQAPEPAGIARPANIAPGDPAIGRQIVVNRQVGMCLLCHGGPFPEERFQGNLGPDLAQSVKGYSEPQLRARIMDPRLVNSPESIMPAYHRVDHLQRVNAAYAGKPVLDLQQIEHVVAFLMTLK